MLKKINIGLVVLIIILSASIIFYIKKTESYIMTINQHLANSSAEVQELERDLAEEKELRQKANWELQMIEARNEGIESQGGN